MKPDWDMFLGAWRSTIEPQYMDQIWAEENIPDLNAVGYINPEVEQLFEEAGKNCDVDFRKENMPRFSRFWRRIHPISSSTNSKAWQGINNRITGIEPTPSASVTTPSIGIMAPQ